MSKLVKKSSVIEEMWNLWNSEINNAAKFTEEETKAVNKAFIKLQSRIEAMPVDYDVEKVVEQIHNELFVFDIPDETCDEVVRKGGVE